MMSSPRLLGRLALAALLAGLSGAAAALDADDAVAGFLAERGLIGGPDRGAPDLVIGAMSFVGVRYRSGGAAEDEGFDCSGFTRRVFASVLGLVLPRRSAEQAAAGALVAVPPGDLKPGDLVFFNTLRQAFSHVGIYVGDGRFIHAPRTGGEVRIDDMRSAYWSRRFDGARRAHVPS